MSLWRALTIQNGITKQIHTPDQLIAGSGVDSDVGVSLALGAANATSITLGGGASTSVTINGTQTFTTGTGAVTIAGNVVSSGAITFDFSTSSGTFKTSTGTNTLNGNTVVSGANSFTTGTGTVIVNGSVTTGNNPNFDFSSSTGTFYTSTGENHLNGNVTLAAGKNMTAAAGSSNFDFSGSTGTFQTSSGAVSVNGNTTFTGLTTVTVASFGTGVVHSSSAGVLSSSLIVNADISPTATIDGTKVNPNFGIQNIVTTGTLSTGAATVTSLKDTGLTAQGIVVNDASGNLTTSVGTDKQILQTESGVPTWVTVSGDTSIADGGAVTVNKLQGNTLTLGTLGAAQDGYVLTWKNSVPALEMISPTSGGLTVTLAGDVTGLSNANTVVKIRGNPVSAVAPTDAQILIEQTGGSGSAWKSLSQDATITDAGVVTVVSAHGDFAVGGNATVTGTLGVTGNTSLSTLGTSGLATLNSLSVTTSATVGTTLGVSGLATLNSAVVTTTLGVDGATTLGSTLAVTGNTTVGGTLGVTGVSTLTGGTLTNSLDSLSGGDALVIGGTNASGAITIGTSTSTVTVPGNLHVTGAETITGTSVFNSAATITSSLTVSDGYSPPLMVVGNALGGVTLNSDTTSETANGSGVVLQNDGYTGLEVDAGPNPGTVNVWIPAGSVLQAAAGGQIIATNSTGTEYLQTTYITTTPVTPGTAVYISADKVASPTDASALASSYCIGFVSSSGVLKTDGRVTPIITGGAHSGYGGTVMYLDDANPGQVTPTPPTTAGHVVAPIGIMVDNDDMMIRWYTPVVL